MSTWGFIVLYCLLCIFEIFHNEMLKKGNRLTSNSFYLNKNRIILFTIPTKIGNYLNIAISH